MGQGAEDDGNKGLFTNQFSIFVYFIIFLIIIFAILPLNSALIKSSKKYIGDFSSQLKRWHIFFCF